MKGAASGNPAGAILLLTVAGAGLLWAAFDRYRTARRLLDTARSKAATAPQGRVELQGAAWAVDADLLVSPSESEVVYYSMTIQREETRGAGKNRRRVWVTVFERKHAPDFFLVDATGLARVGSSNAEVDLAAKRTRPWRALSTGERDRILAYAADHGIAGFPPSDSFFGFFSTPYRIVECEIPLGSPLYVNGDFCTLDGSPERVRSRGLTAFHRQFFDAAARDLRSLGTALGVEGSGGPSAAEVAEGMCRAAVIARRSAAGQDAVEDEFVVSGRMGAGATQRLLVADRLEEHLVAEKKRGILLPGLGGVAALAAAAYLFGVAPSLSLQVVPPFLTKPSAKTAPVLAGHEALRGRCLGGTAAACEELLRRADELRIPEGFRREYASRACSLGNASRCAAVK